MNFILLNNLFSLLALDRNKNEINFKKNEIDNLKIKYEPNKIVYRKLSALPKAFWNGIIKTSFDFIRIIFIGIPLSLHRSFYLKKYSFTFVRHCQNSFGRIISIFNDKFGMNHVKKSENYLTYYNYTSLLDNQVDKVPREELKENINTTIKTLTEAYYNSKLLKITMDCKNSFSIWLRNNFLKNEKINLPVNSNNFLKEIIHLQKIFLDKNGIIQFQKFSMKKLNSFELVNLYKILKCFQIVDDDNIISKTIIFNIEDYFYKLCLKEKNETTGQAHDILQFLKELNNEQFNNLINTMEKLLNPTTFLSFHSLINKNKPKELTKLKDAKIVLHPVEDSSSKRSLKVLKLAVESIRNHVGGISSVLNASSKAHREMNLEKVYGFHPFYSHDKLNVNVKFIGVIKHQFKGKIVESSIYKDIENKEYLVQPDEAYQSLFDIGNKKNVYNSYDYSCLIDRYTYMASASSVFTALYAGKKGNKAIDILQADSFSVGGLGFELMNSTIEPLMKEANLTPPKRIYLTHGLMGHHAQGHCSSKYLEEIGGNIKNYGDHLNLTASGLIHSHLNIFVSKGVAQDAISDNPMLNMGLKEATLTNKGINKVKAITNGINPNLHDRCNPNLLGEHALVRTFEGNIETTDFVAHQDKIKELLYEAKIIPDPKKPLFLFVGRYSSEKGIDMLPSLVKEVKKQGGQCVIMGTNCGSFLCNRTIDKLKKVSKKNPNLLKVYDQPQDQEGALVDDKNQPLYPLENKSFVKKSSLIRQAASFFVVPSHAEACGLVPMEGHCTGAVVIAPYIQGLKDMCVPLNSEDNEGNKRGFKNGANAACYSDDSSVSQFRKAVSEAYQSFSELSYEEKNRYMLENYKNSKINYSWFYKDESSGILSGAAYEYSKVYHELFHEKEIHPKVETFDEAIRRTTLL